MAAAGVGEGEAGGVARGEGAGVAVAAVAEEVVPA